MIKPQNLLSLEMIFDLFYFSSKDLWVFSMKTTKFTDYPTFQQIFV